MASGHGLKSPSSRRHEYETTGPLGWPSQSTTQPKLGKQIMRRIVCLKMLFVFWLPLPPMITIKEEIRTNLQTNMEAYIDKAFIYNTSTYTC